MELSGKAGGPVEIKTTDDDELAKMLERLTQEEAVEFLRLFNKARGVSVEPTEPKDVRRKDDEEDK
jgi:bifunctional DNA-binding transcriptional regulator/antitoxin component of YhaV-PrlF toxin-antitoxin module